MIPLLVAGAGKLPHVRVVALVADLMDRSRISGAIADVTFANDAAATLDADVVVVDHAPLASRGTPGRDAAPRARSGACGAHVDTDAIARAVDDGADVAIARSQFFRDPATAVTDADAST